MRGGLCVVVEQGGGGGGQSAVVNIRLKARLEGQLPVGDVYSLKLPVCSLLTFTLVAFSAQLDDSPYL